jgi:hypothetical protein
VSNIFELRQYTLKPGKRDVLIDLFERQFVESQEAEGIDLIGTFRDADNTDRFVWLRGFADMESRARSLAAFYGGPVWKAHRNAANDTMIDSDNVLLLRAAWEDSGFENEGTRASPSATGSAQGAVIASIFTFDAPVTQAFIEAWRAMMPGRIQNAGGRLVATCITESSVNTFAALPVREGENVFVSFALFPSANAACATELPVQLEQLCAKPPEVLRLYPTARSRLHR